MMLRDYLAVVLGMAVTFVVLYNAAGPAAPAPSVSPPLSGRYINLSALRTDCARPCALGEAPRVCYFRFAVEALWTDRACGQCSQCPCVPAEGVERVVVTINRQLPGPALHVCEGDIVVVDVENRLQGQETALHWHGVHQKGSPYMDGVPMVTQCPIHSGTSFRYMFRANSGTHFYRAYSAAQQTDGVFGPLVVRQPLVQDPVKHSYDLDLQEHVLTISPWTQWALSTHLGFDRAPVLSLLINGKGASTGTNSTLTNRTIPAKFRVKRWKRYRFRVISATSLDCPVLLSVDSHQLTIAAVDGSPVKLIKQPSVHIYPGERYDLILHADQPKAAYALRLRGYRHCEGMSQEAVVLYQGGEERNMSSQHGPLRAAATTRSHDKPGLAAHFPQLRSLLTVPELRHKQQADYRVYIPFDVAPLDSPALQPDFSYTYLNASPHYPSYLSSPDEAVRAPRMRNLSFAYPAAPLLSQREQGSAPVLCSQARHGGPYCECVHLLRLPLASTVDIVLIHIGDAEDGPHVFHLHGSSVHVLGGGPLGQRRGLEEVKALERRGQLRRNLVDPPLRDMLVVPSGGYLVARLRTDNPGYWMLESRTGDLLGGPAMALVVRVGERDAMPPVPPGFPRCGSFKRPEFVV